MNENKAIQLLSQQREQYEREVKNLIAQAEGVKRAIEITQAKVTALTDAIQLIDDHQP